MSAHIALPQIETDLAAPVRALSEREASVAEFLSRTETRTTRVTLPSTLSSKIMTGLLREELKFDGLIVDFAARHRASAIVRGLRAVSDFEYEFQMALMNRRLDARVETVFMMPAAEYSYISSRLVKEVVMLGGSVTGLVPEAVERRLNERRPRA